MEIEKERNEENILSYLASEKNISRFYCSIKKKKLKNYNLIVTDLRLIFLEINPEEEDSANNFSIFFVDIEIDNELLTRIKANDNDESLFLACIQCQKKKPVYLRFSDKEILINFKQLFMSCYNLAKLMKNEISLIKFKLLIEKSEIRELYEELVLKKKIISEENFWKKQELIKDFSKISDICEQSLGKTAKTWTNLNKKV